MDKLQPFDDKGYNLHRRANGNKGTPHTQEHIQSVKGGNSPCAKPVVRYTKDGKKLNIYGSITEAVDDNTDTSVKRIVMCCKGQATTNGGYRWSYGDKNLPPIRKRGKPVRQICKKTNKVIATFPSTAQAAKDIGCFPGDIGDVCKKKYGSKTAGGYKWEFVNEA